jgi:hypothetical protein
VTQSTTCSRGWVVAIVGANGQGWKRKAGDHLGADDVAASAAEVALDRGMAERRQDRWPIEEWVVEVALIRPRPSLR